MKNKIKQEIIDLADSLQLYQINISPKDSLQRAKKKIKDCYVDWNYLSYYYKLSEELIREFQDKVDWVCISETQFLSKKFIKEFKNKINWAWISESQHLSEDFISEFKDLVCWENICTFQILSEKFIRKFWKQINLVAIVRYQKLSPKFIKEFGLTIPESNALYTPNSEKLKYIKENTSYEVVDDKYIFAYKSVRKNMRSVYQPHHYLYEIGKEYKSHCNCNIDNPVSFGLAAWTKEAARDFHHSGKLLRVRIDIDDIGCIVRSDKKIRCRKLTVLEVVS